MRNALLALSLASLVPFLTAQDAGTTTGARPLGGSLPAIASVGALPDGERFTVELHHNGMLSLAGVPVTFDEFAEQLATRARATLGERTGHLPVSDLNVHVRAAGALPVAVVHRIASACARSDVATPRLFFGVRHREDGQEGAFAWFLPVDNGSDPNSRPEVLQVRVAPGIEGDPSGLAASLKRFAAAMTDDQRRTAIVDIEVPGDLRWDRAIELLDAAALSGLQGAWLSCRETEAQDRAWNAAATRHDLHALAKASPAIATAGCMLGPMAVRADDAIRAPRTPDAFAGFASSPIAPSTLEGLVPTAPGDEPPAVGGKYGSRDEEEKVGQKVGRATGRAIERGLAWLAAHQDRDGRWDADEFMKHDVGGGEPCDGAGESPYDVGVTGLALLAFLSDGNTLRTGPHRATVRRAANWLQKQQRDNGLIGDTSSHDFVYGHAIATLALVETYGLSQYEPLKQTAQQAINYLESHRNPYSVWRYQPRDNDNDTAITTWCAHAYLAARDFRLETSNTAIQMVGVYLDQVATPDGRHGYTKAGEPSAREPGDHATRFPPEKNEAMTGAALFVRRLLGQTPASHQIVERSADVVVAKLPAWTPKAGNIDLYAWYWSTLAMYQTGGEHWQKWQAPIETALVDGQNRSGNADGSWDPIGAWGHVGGRVYSTAMATMTLQTPYRYTRVVR